MIILDNVLQNYLDNDIYRDKIMIWYYAYILDFCNSEYKFCVVYNSIWEFTIKIIIFITIMNLRIISTINLSKLPHSPKIEIIAS